MCKQRKEEIARKSRKKIHDLCEGGLGMITLCVVGFG